MSHLLLEGIALRSLNRHDFSAGVIFTDSIGVILVGVIILVDLSSVGVNTQSA